VDEKEEEIQSGCRDEIELLFYLFRTRLDIEKVKKVGSNIVVIDKREEGEKFDEERVRRDIGEYEITPKFVYLSDDTFSLNGCLALSRLECSKDLWLTDKEWQDYRLRVLKERLLFYI
jgi:hypothetical protein